MKAQVAVVGAGLSGLACALTLQQNGVEVVVVEAAPRVGGRVQTDSEDGYTFDVGFQVLLTGYPAAREWLDLEALDLRCFPSGALIHKQRRWHTYADPLRQPQFLWKTLTSPVGSLQDKLRLAWLRFRLWSGQVEPQEGESTLQFLSRWGFTRAMVEDFFSPFFGGVFLESELATSASKFLELFHLFSTSSAAVPAQGMAAIPKQLARGLIREPLLATPVEALDGTDLITSSGRVAADCIVLAGPGPETLYAGSTSFHPAQTYYFSCSDEFLVSSMLMLDADSGPINNIAPLSRIAPYAPRGRHLVAVSVLGAPRPASEVGLALTGLLPADWEFLRHYSIEHALPLEERRLMASPQLSDLVFRCGDHRCSGSIQGALQSGRATARVILSKRPWLKNRTRA